MRTVTLLIIFAAAAFADERNVKLANPASTRDLQEFATILRTVGQIRTVRLDEGPAFHIEGTEAETAVAEWMLRQLDRPVGWRPSEQDLTNPAARTYQSRVRVFYLPDGVTPQRTQETLTILRTVLDTKQIFNSTTRQALISSGTPAELDAIDWVLKAITGNAASAPYRIEDARFDTLQVFPLAPATSREKVSQVLTRLRTELRIQKVFPLTAPPVIVVRSTAADVDRAAQILKSY